MVIRFRSQFWILTKLIKTEHNISSKSNLSPDSEVLVRKLNIFHETLSNSFHNNFMFIKYWPQEGKKRKFYHKQNTDAASPSESKTFPSLIILPTGHQHRAKMQSAIEEMLSMMIYETASYVEYICISKSMINSKCTSTQCKKTLVLIIRL